MALPDGLPHHGPEGPQAPSVGMGALQLSRAATVRDAERRRQPDLLDRLWADPTTRVLRLKQDRAAVREGTHGRDLALAEVSSVSRPGSDDGWVFLGSDEDHGYVSVPENTFDGGPCDDDEGWAGLREVGSELGDRDAGLFTQAVALHHWHRTHRHCPRCGAVTVPAEGGHLRRCPVDDSEHHPRTDPAVIMAVVDADDRILLGRQEVWPAGRFSTLAGFVEAGEPLEAAVRREVFEEAGVPVGAVHYRGSQPWPFPCSLMVGFRAEATGTDVRVDEDEIAEARWFDRAGLLADIEAGIVALPGPLAISRRLIEDWFGGELPDHATWG